MKGKRLITISAAIMLIVLASVGWAVDKPMQSTAFSIQNTKAAKQQALQSQNQNSKLGVRPGVVLVKFKDPLFLEVDQTGKRQLSRNAEAKVAAVASHHNLAIKDELVFQNVILMSIQDDQAVEVKVAELRKDPAVSWAQPDYQYKLHSVNPYDDGNWYSMWALSNVGQPVNGITGKYGADIRMTEAWAISDGGAYPVTVAVIDTGVAYNHSDLATNMWDGSLVCKDENNSLIPGGCPNHGWDYDDNNGAGSDNDPAPGGMVAGYYDAYYSYHPHGTHVAGTIAAADNTVGSIGVAPKAKIMALKTYELHTSSIVKAIAFAKNNGAKVINASWGGEGDDPVLKESVANFPGLFVASAGNSASDSRYTLPCNFDLTNVVCVAATDQNDDLANFSNYGNVVQVGAPGVNIFSTVPLYDLIKDKFETLQVPTLPSDFTSSAGSQWRSVDITKDLLGMGKYGSEYGKVVFGDNSFPYSDNANTTLTSSVFDLSDSSAADIAFDCGCDTPYDSTNWTDYMVLEATNDGGMTWNELVRWDKAVLNGPGKGGYGLGYYYSFFESAMLTGSFQFRFRWVTDATDNNHGGCFVDYVWFSAYTRGKLYDWAYWDGTSMATPHVVGLAALLWGTNDKLTIAQVKDVLVNSGDLLDSLSGKIASGKRINARNALKMLADTTPPKVTTLELIKLWPYGAQVLQFSESIGEASRNAIQQAILTELKASGFKSTMNFSWNEDSNKLIFYPYGETAVFKHSVFTNVADVMGNMAKLTLIKSLYDTKPPVVKGVSDGKTYDHAVQLTFNEGYATLNGQQFASGGWVRDNASYHLVVIDRSDNVTVIDFIINQPLKISKVAVKAGTVSATVKWVTSIRAASTLSFGTKPDDLSSEINGEKPVINHSLKLSGLDSGRKYYYRVSALVGGQWVQSPLKNFTTK